MHGIWVIVLGTGWAGLKGLGQFIKEFQSLLAGLMALLAAVIALRPVYKQLHVNQVQTAIAARELLFGRTRTIDRRRKTSSEEVRKITADFTARLYQGDQEGGPDIDPHWAHEADQIVGQVIEEFVRQQTGMGDREAIEEKRAFVIQTATALQRCLTDIHQIHSFDFDDHENGWSEEATQKNRAVAEAASTEAEKHMDARISAVARSGKELDDAYVAELNEIRVRVLQINKLVLSEDHSAERKP
jgi:hypothetical protein